MACQEIKPGAPFERKGTPGVTGNHQTFHLSLFSHTKTLAEGLILPVRFNRFRGLKPNAPDFLFSETDSHRFSASVVRPGGFGTVKTEA